MILKSLCCLSMLTVLMVGCDSPRRHCGTRETCLKDPKCLCWCSQGCGYRKKTNADNPIYIEDDSNGKHCYCKQWDLDYYDANCIQKQKIQQPKGAQ